MYVLELELIVFAYDCKIENEGHADRLFGLCISGSW